MLKCVSRPIALTLSSAMIGVSAEGSTIANTTGLAAEHPPEAMGGGAGRPGSRPLASDLSARGTKNALLGHLRRPPGAWPAWPPARGVSENDFAASAPPCPRLCVEGSPGSFPAKSEVGAPRHRRSDGLSASRARYRTAAPGSCAETRPCRRNAVSSPRRAHTAMGGRPESSSAYIHNEPRLTIPGCMCRAQGNIGPTAAGLDVRLTRQPARVRVPVSEN